MTETPSASPVQAIPFLVPPAGRPLPVDREAADHVRNRLSTKEAHAALGRLSDAMPLSKRLLDIVGSSLLMLALSPLLIAVALAIKLTDGGKVLFWQKRVGLRGREFPFPKFRSMMPHADRLVRMLATRNQHAAQKGDASNVEAGTDRAAKKRDITFKMKDDPRITWIGRIIRKFSIDEMPQLWCVLNGDMSLVGPRPPLPSEVARYTPNDRRRLDVTPGLTCIWQVSGRGDLPFPQQVALDIEYIEKRSFWFDLKLLFLTVPAVLRGRGAY